LFDKADRHWFAITIEGGAHSGVRLTQPEINRVIQSFRVAPSSPTNLGRQVSLLQRRRGRPNVSSTLSQSDRSCWLARSASLSRLDTPSFSKMLLR
jgi:hypothetical protein